MNTPRKTPAWLTEHLREIGRVGGQSRSPRKMEAVMRNLESARQVLLTKPPRKERAK
jgi:hypothetical protein